MKTIAITIDEAMLESVDRLAGHHGDTPNRSKVIRAAVGEYLARIARGRGGTRAGSLPASSRAAPSAGRRTREGSGEAVKRGEIYRTAERIPERGHKPGFYADVQT